ncbi:glucosaminidase domain-containing protein [Paenibacillus sp.]|uniref:glucosaminidase domain-containing protein n=1 Tax=Paenibacillus sp. TaxID=58172 RepID=UPI00283AB1EE|nr:glucosaminidase domain-containing protein [Paenibacillus sp.]
MTVLESSPLVIFPNVLSPVYSLTSPQARSFFPSLQAEALRSEKMDMRKSVRPLNLAGTEQPRTYQVTATYLNVRSEPTAKSRILAVQEQGNMLQIVNVTENGWLKLKDGGYVHSGYAKKIEGQTSALSPDTVTKEKHPEQQIPKTSAKPAAKRSSDKPSAPSSSIRSVSGLEASHIKELFRGTGLAGHELEEAVLEIEDKYGINAYFTIAVMKLESGNGRSKLARGKNNLFGLNASGGSNEKALYFKSKEDCVEKVGQLLSKNYVKKGYTTIEKVAKKYCPANPKWPSLVKGIMKSDYKKI